MIEFLGRHCEQHLKIKVELHIPRGEVYWTMRPEYYYPLYGRWLRFKTRTKGAFEVVLETDAFWLDDWVEKLVRNSSYMFFQARGKNTPPIGKTSLTFVGQQTNDFPNQWTIFTRLDYPVPMEQLRRMRLINRFWERYETLGLTECYEQIFDNSSYMFRPRRTSSLG